MEREGGAISGIARVLERAPVFEGHVEAGEFLKTIREDLKRGFVSMLNDTIQKEASEQIDFGFEVKDDKACLIVNWPTLLDDGAVVARAAELELSNRVGETGVVVNKVTLHDPSKLAYWITNQVPEGSTGEEYIKTQLADINELIESAWIKRLREENWLLEKAPMDVSVKFEDGRVGIRVEKVPPPIQKYQSPPSPPPEESEVPDWLRKLPPPAETAIAATFDEPQEAPVVFPATAAPPPAAPVPPPSPEREYPISRMETGNLVAAVRKKGRKMLEGMNNYFLDKDIYDTDDGSYKGSELNWRKVILPAVGIAVIACTLSYAAGTTFLNPARGKESPPRPSPTTEMAPTAVLAQEPTKTVVPPPPPPPTVVQPTATKEVAPPTTAPVEPTAAPTTKPPEAPPPTATEPAPTPDPLAGARQIIDTRGSYRPMAAEQSDIQALFGNIPSEVQGPGKYVYKPETGRIYIKIESENQAYPALILFDGNESKAFYVYKKGDGSVGRVEIKYEDAQKIFLQLEGAKLFWNPSAN